MSAANFRSMDFGMPMIIGRTYEQMAKEYESEFGEEFNEDMFSAYEQDDFESAMELAGEFSDGLTFHIVEVISGYYSGFQFFVKERYEDQFDLDPESRYCIDNDEAHYYFDTYRSVALRRAESEKRKIARWLNQLTQSGFNRIACVGRFSNGEATYDFA